MLGQHSARRAAERGPRRGVGPAADRRRVRRTPAEELAALDWQREGACRDEDSALFFGPVQIEENARERILRVRAAKRICERCPVLERCRGYALDHEEEYGVWGGMSARERGMLVRARHRRV